jgi:hypothetical protein
MNKSKKLDPRYWRIWKQSGAVEAPFAEVWFTFGKIKQSSVDPDHYAWEVMKRRSKWMCSSGSTVKNIEPILRHFGIKNLTKLSGRSFKIPIELGPDISNAFDFLMLIARNGGVYTPPKIQSVQDKILNALSMAHAASFNTIDSATVAEAAAGIFGNSFSMSEDTFNLLRDEVSKRSQQKYSLQLADRSEFSFGVKGPYAYLKLIDKEGVETLVGFGPYNNPITIER